MSAMFYWAVVQAVMIFGTETWVLSEAMVLLIQITGQKSKHQRDRTWRSAAAEKVIKEAVTQSLGAYIDKRQATVAEWVDLRLILEVCDKETGYKGGGMRQDTWWRKNGVQEASECYLKIYFGGGKGEVLEIRQVW